MWPIWKTKTLSTASVSSASPPQRGRHPDSESDPLSDPIRDLKQLPWSSTLQSAVIIGLIGVLLDWLLDFSFKNLVTLTGILQFLFASRFASLTLCGLGILLGIGTTEVYRRQAGVPMLSLSVTWALVGSLLLVLLGRWLLGFAFGSLLPPAIVTNVEYVSLIGIVIGAFWRSWWRR